MSFVFVSPFVSTLLTLRKCRLHHSSGNENHLSRRQKNETTTTTTTFLSTKTFWNHHLHRRHTIGDVDDDDDVFDDAKVFEEDEGRRRDKSRFGRTAMALVLSAGMMLLQPTTTFEAHASVTEEADDGDSEKKNAKENGSKVKMDLITKTEKKEKLKSAGTAIKRIQKRH